MNKTIEIPEGYEARIEGNKVILEPKESEDERIRKQVIEQLIEFICWAVDRGSITEKQREMSNFWIAWLKKQGEQNPAWSEEDENNLYLITTAVAQKYSGELFLGKKQKEIVCTGRYLLDWLKSLKDRCTWKPSDEQIV